MLQASPGSAAAFNERGSVPPIFISCREVQRRYGVSHETLKRWREAGTGPRYTRIGGRIKYRLDDVIAYEAARTFTSTRDEARGAA